MLAQRRFSLVSRFQPRPHFLLYALLFAAVIAYLFAYQPNDPNWSDDFYSAGRAVLNGQNPYNGFFVFPPWLLVLLTPLALFPPAAGRAILIMLNMLGFIYAARHFRATPLATIIFLLSPIVLLHLTWVDLDGLIVFGLAVSPTLGLFFVSLKPQFAASIAIFWFAQILQTKGWSAVLRAFAPITIVGLLSILVYGMWFVSGLQRLTSLPSASWNASLFPTTIPLGLVLMIQSLRTRDIRWAMPASLCLSPYVSLQGWAAGLLALVGSQPLLVAAVIGIWTERLLVFIRQ